MKQGHERPVDRVAARVVSRGESYEFRPSAGAVNSDLPLPVRKPTVGEIATSTFLDLSGRKLGRLTVIGLSATTPARWVCRCICGIYALRTSKAIKAAASDACCDQCHLLAVAKRKDFVRRTGKHVECSEFLK